MPDIIFPAVNNHRDIGEAELKNPLPWDIIPTAKLEQAGITFEKDDIVSPLIAPIMKRVTSRITKDQDWKYIQEDIERYKKLKERKHITLNENKRIEEREVFDKLIEERKKEINERDFPTFRKYSLTLQNVAKGELPEPKDATDIIEIEDDEADQNAIHEEEEEEEDPIPIVDVGMKEAKRILIYMLDLLTKKPAVATTTK